VEFTKGLINEHARFGIATVQPNRAIKKCKIRKLRVEYFLDEIAVLLVAPKSCVSCDRREECTDDFMFQIIEKYNERNKHADAYYLL
jgi:hypothetical protein